MDTDRLIATLPDALRRVLHVEYVISGTFKQRVKEAGISTPTYYRNLKRAKLALWELMVDKGSDSGAEVAA